MPRSMGLAYDSNCRRCVHVPKPKVYADNFRFGRLDNWTH